MMNLPVGLGEIVERLGVARGTGYQWKKRGVLPAADFDSVNGHPAWKWSTILRWAGQSGRLLTDELRDEYRQRFKGEPT